MNLFLSYRSGRCDMNLVVGPAPLVVDGGEAALGNVELAPHAEIDGLHVARLDCRRSHHLCEKEQLVLRTVGQIHGDLALDQRNNADARHNLRAPDVWH